MKYILLTLVLTGCASVSQPVYDGGWQKPSQPIQGDRENIKAASSWFLMNGSEPHYEGNSEYFGGGRGDDDES
jgi:hypothetical protein